MLIRTVDNSTIFIDKEKTTIIGKNMDYPIYSTEDRVIADVTIIDGISYFLTVDGYIATEHIDGAFIHGISDIICIAHTYNTLYCLSVDGTVYLYRDDIAIQIDGLSDIVDIACGFSDTMFLSSNGTVSLIDDYDEITHLDVRNIKRIGAYNEVFVFLYEDGTVGMMSSSIDDDMDIVKISHLYDIEYMSVGYGHMFFITTDNRVFGYGDSSYGCIPDQSEDDVYETPILLNMNDVVHISCQGGYYSVFLHADGRITSCGDNRHGQLTLYSRALIPVNY
jgi:alpha-tubulin suppressor-like RCC1 family protein